MENIQKEWNFKNKPCADQALGKAVMFENIRVNESGTQKPIKYMSFLIFRAQVGNKIQSQHANRHQVRGRHSLHPYEVAWTH